MDIATILGLGVGTVMIVWSIFSSGSDLNQFLHVPSLLIIVGGSFVALFIHFPWRSIWSVFRVLRRSLTEAIADPQDVIQQFHSLSAVARRDGLLALEEQVPRIENEFMARGLEMVAAGASREELQAVMGTAINASEQRHHIAKQVLDALASSASALGAIGTLIGMVQLLRTLDDPAQITTGLATSLLATLYGAGIAHLICIPLGGKLEARNKEEVLVNELILTGLASLIEGENPRAIEMRLQAHLVPRRERSQAVAA